MAEIGQALRWWLIVVAVGWIAFPICYVTFHPLGDRGLGVSKALGVLLVTYAAWICAFLKLFPFAESTVIGLTVLLAVISEVVLIRRWRDIRQWLAENWRLAFGMEGLALLFFAVFALFRAFRPDFLDGEKRMDHVLMMSLYTSQYFPAHDAWYAGGHVNYYYFGQMIAATLGKLTGCRWEYIYNLACATVPALVAPAAFGLGFSLTGRRATGLLCIVLYCIASNLEGIRLLIVDHGQIRPYFLWDCSRVIVDVWQTDHEPGRYVINEFPYFTFLFGDLHAHLSVMPLGFLFMALALAIRLNGTTERWWQGLALCAWPVPLVLGGIAATNTWDAPACALLLGLVLISAWPEGFMRDSRLRLPLIAGGSFALVILALGLARILYHHFFSIFRPDVRWWEWRRLPQPASDPASYFCVWALGLFIVAAYLVCRVALAERERKDAKFIPWDIFLAIAIAWVIMKWLFKRDILVLAVLLSLFALTIIVLTSRRRIEPAEHFVLLTIGLAAFLLIWAELFYKVGYLGPPHLRMDTVFKMHLEAWMLLAPANAFGLCWLWHHREEFSTRLNWLAPLCLSVLGLFSTIGSWLRPTQNRSVIVMATAGGLTVVLLVIAGIMAYRKARFRFNAALAGIVGAGILFVLTLPVVILGTPNRLNGFRAKPTLDILVGVKQQWPAQYEAMRWVYANTKGDDVVLEAAEFNDGHSDYSEIGQLSAATGRPTLAAWQSHIFQWHVGDPQTDEEARERQKSGGGSGQINDLRRGAAWSEIYRRQEVVKTIYVTPDARLAANLAWENGIDYVYIGPIERQAYPELNVTKFEGWPKVFETDGAVIYRVPPRAEEGR